MNVEMENKQVNILMVDDHPENLFTLEAVLTSPQYRLIKAESGVEALKWVLKEDFAVILMDVQMPILNGFDTVKMIRERDKTKEVPIIFMTALSHTMENVLYGYSVGAIDYIIKPFDPIILKCKVEGFVSLYLHKQKIIEQNEIIESRTKELQSVYAKLKKREAMSRAVKETSLDSIIFIDEQLKILTVNPAIFKMFGYTSDEIIGQRIDVIFDSPNSSLMGHAEFETIGIRKNETSFPAEVHIADAKVEGEKLFVCTIRDITERKNYFERLEMIIKERTMELREANKRLKEEIEEKQSAIQQLYESEEKYRQLVENSPEAILVRHLYSEKISFINDTAVKLFKAKNKKDLIGKSIFDIISSDDHDDTRRRIKLLEKGITLAPFEEKLICMDGSLVEAEVKVIPFVYEGTESLHIVIRDLTEYKKSQEFIQRTEKLNVVGELAAGIAHEIRNPLTSIKGFTQLLENRYASGKDYVDIMISEIDRINTIVGELLLLAKPNSYDFKKVDLGKLIYEVETLMRAQANLHGILIIHNSQLRNHDVFLLGVESKIKQVFINIIKNAIEATEIGGQIIISTELKGSSVVISFMDNGAGIPQNIIENIGKPFFTTKENGTGLGLMVSNNIIESHKGKLTISSKVGVGTTIQVSLPIVTDL